MLKRTQKKGPPDANAETTLKVIQQFWPEYIIDQHALKHPTREFFLKFYFDFADYIEEKLLSLSSSLPKDIPYSESNSDDEEVQLYLRLRNILPQSILLDFEKFYVYDPKVHYPFMVYIVHYLNFIKETLKEDEESVKKIINSGSDLKRDEDKYEELLEANLNKQSDITLKKNERRKVAKNVAELEISYQQVHADIIKSMEKNKKFIADIENLKCKQEGILNEIEKLKKQKADLEECIVDEEEMNQLNKLLESVNSDWLALDKDIKSDSKLLNERKECNILFQKSLRIMESLKIPSELKQLNDLRVKINEEEKQVNSLVKNSDQQIQKLEEKKIITETERETLENKIEESKKVLKSTTEKYIIEERNLTKQIKDLHGKNGHSDKKQQILDEIEELNKNLADFNQIIHEKLDQIHSNHAEILSEFEEFIKLKV